MVPVAVAEELWEQGEDGRLSSKRQLFLWGCAQQEVVGFKREKAKQYIHIDKKEKK